ncbi:Hypothetical protein A7982_03313 [Minicystis rosea]|nr:Hypothetical protein A7982_03313 [Minicystis rosea]
MQADLTWVFERLGTHREMFGLALEALTPAAVKGSYLQDRASSS